MAYWKLMPPISAYERITLSAWHLFAHLLLTPIGVMRRLRSPVGLAVVDR